MANTLALIVTTIINSLLLPLLLTTNDHHVFSFTMPSYLPFPSTSLLQYHDGRFLSSTQLNVISSKQNSNGKSMSSSYYNQDDNTELNRTKFLLNQARGNLQESEMRATAAERRVAMLQKEIRELNDGMKDKGKETTDEEQIIDVKNFANNNDNNDLEESKINSLRKKIVSLKNSINHFRSKMQNEIEKLQSNYDNDKSLWQKQEEQLRNELDKAQSEQNKANNDIKELNNLMLSLKKDLEDLKHKSMNEKKQLELEKKQIETDALEVQNNLEVVNSQLQTKLKDEQITSENLRSDLTTLETEKANLLAKKVLVESELQIVEKDLIFHKIELDDRNSQIEVLEDERSSVRTLMKIQYALIKSRIVKRYKKLLRKT